MSKFETRFAVETTLNIDDPLGQLFGKVDVPPATGSSRLTCGKEFTLTYGL